MAASVPAPRGPSATQRSRFEGRWGCTVDATSSRFREMSTPVSALLTGHPTFVASAAAANRSASSPSTSPETVSVIPVSRKPPAGSGPEDDVGLDVERPGRSASLGHLVGQRHRIAGRVRGGDQLLRAGRPRRRPRPPAWGTTPRNEPTPELVISTCPKPCWSVPVQAVLAVRVGMGSSVRGLRSASTIGRFTSPPGRGPCGTVGARVVGLRALASDGARGGTLREVGDLLLRDVRPWPREPGGGASTS